MKNYTGDMLSANDDGIFKLYRSSTNHQVTNLENIHR